MTKRSHSLLVALRFGIGKVLYIGGFAQYHHGIHNWAMTQLQKAAVGHHQGAQLLLGQLLKYRGTSIQAKAAGIEYLRQAASSGSCEACFMLAEATADKNLIMGSAHQRDRLGLYLQAAEAGHIMAALRLSQFYREGSADGDINIKQADYWLEQFMKNGQCVEL